MKCMVVVLAVASLCLAEPEADPLHYYAPYGYAHGYAYGHGYDARPYFASGYATPLAGGYAAVHRLHKREAEADAQIIAGPLTPAFGDAVATPRGLESLALNGFSEDLNQDGFVDPIAQAVPAPVAFAAPAVAPLAFAAPAVAAPAVATLNALPFAAPALPVAAPVAAVAHAPVVKSVVDAPAVVNTEVHAAPIFHHAPLVNSFAAAPALAPVALNSHACVTPGGCAAKAALLTGAPAGAFGHVTSHLVKREAEAEPEADAEADADAYYYGHYGYNTYAASPYAYNPFYNYFGAYSGYYNPYNYNAYAAYPYAAPVAAPAPVVAAAPAPVVAAAPAPLVAAPVKQVTRPVTYTHIGAHPVAPTTVLETETFV